MSNFDINLRGIENKNYLKRVKKDMQSIEESIENIEGNLRKGASFGQLRRSLKKIIGEIQTEEGKVWILQERLNQIAFLYKETENRITEKSNLIVSFKHYDKGVIGEHSLDSIVFDNEGEYGGDQGVPRKNAEEYYDIVRKYYPDITDKEIETLLRKLNSEGCGYVAVINTIFAEFEGKEAEFEEIFGFPMYNDENDLNFDKLLVDFYCATDNRTFQRDGEVEINSYEDYNEIIDGPKEDYREWDDSTGRGTTSKDRENRAGYYLKEKGIQLEVEHTKRVTVENFSELSKEGYIMISFHDGNLQNVDGNTAQYIDGGHAMTVTGVTSDGRFIVSSWGDKYYIDPEEVVIKKKEDGKEIETSMSFSYYQYK